MPIPFSTIISIIKSMLENGTSFTFLNAGSAADTFSIINLCMEVCNFDSFGRTVLLTESAADTAVAAFFHGNGAFLRRGAGYRIFGRIRY